MSAWSAHVAAFGFSFAGMAALSLALDRHYEQFTGIDTAPRRHRLVLRLLGWALLGAALWSCAASAGWGVGLVAWSAWLAAGAMAVGWTLPYVPRWTVRAAVAAGAAALLASALG